MEDYQPTSKKDVHSVKRLKDKASYDQGSVFSVLDAGIVAHVTFKLPAVEDGQQDDEWPQPAIPMVYGRKDDIIYLHGHLTAGVLKSLDKDGATVSLTVTTVQGAKVAMCRFHHLILLRS